MENPPTNPEAPEKCYFSTHWLDAGFVRPLLIQGAEQAGDAGLPEFHVRRDLRCAVREALAKRSYARRWMGVPGGWRDVQETESTERTGRILVAVGPEGGWTDDEIAVLSDQGFGAVSMGPRTLRSDTACVALLSLAIRSRALAGASI